MAGKTLARYETDSGIVVENAFTQVVFFATDQGPDKVVRQVWGVWASRAAFDAGKPQIGQHEYVTRGPDADLAATQPQLYSAVVGALTQVALATLDVPGGLDANGAPVLVSFLDGAVDA